MLFRVGDFYETFGEDAITTSRVLGITLTKRNNGGSDIELAGFPYHALDTYLPRLVRGGYRVAICEQLEKPSKEKKLVKRGVTEMVTPGITTSDKLLDHKTNNFLAAVAFSRKGHHGTALLDISTGEFLVSEGNIQYVDKLLQGLNPSEVIFAKASAKQFTQQFGDQFHTYPLDDWVFAPDYTREKLLTQFETNSLKGFGVEGLEMAQIAAGAILHYLATTENTNLKHVTSISRIQPYKYVWLDRFTIRNLELIYPQHENGVALLDILDKTVSPMGGRLLKKWIVLPLKVKKAIDARLQMVEYFIRQQDLRTEIDANIRVMGDLERLISKVPLGKINPREVVQLKRALEAIQPIKEILAKSGNPSLEKIATGLDPCGKITEQIGKEIMEDPPAQLGKGEVIAAGVSEELDEYRSIIKNGKDLLIDIQTTEAERTGIASLKIGFNNVFGYYLEVTNKYKNQGMVPDTWIRKQTLTNSERYITDELKKLESKILSAEEKIDALEADLFQQLVMSIADFIHPVQRNANLIAQLDCLMAFAKIALKNEYCRPDITEDLQIDIKDGRHPVIEHQLPLGETYVPNDVRLDHDDQQILMITGPNMSGKSALLRQTALICLMAQMGSFVPAKSASLGIVDKVFTRVGASDNISSGESTFMVEMNETASIMNNISDRSLILLDEIGRGTSTFDGVSIAWSIAEYLHTNDQARPKTLFATHYHELNELTHKFPRIKNFHVSTKEVGQKVIFLRKLIPGGSNHSFGIYVAKMAGMPQRIVDRANHILAQLEQHHIDPESLTGEEKPHNLPAARQPRRQQLKDLPQPVQLSIFESTDPRLEKVKELLGELDLNAMTPIEALMKLQELKGVLGG